MKRTYIGTVHHLRYWMLSFAVLSVAAGLYYNAREPVRYKSTVILFIKDPGVARDGSPFALPDHSPNVKQVFHSATSTSMLNHLIRTYDLMDHYHIGRSDPFKQEKVLARLQRSIRAVLVEMNGISITVQDRDRDMAAAMANAIYAELQESIQKQLVSELVAARKVHEEVVERTGRSAEEKLQRLSALVMDAPAGTESGDPLSRFNFQLMKLAGQVASANAEVMDAQRYHEIISRTLVQKDNLPRIQLVRRAVRDISTSPVRIAVWRVLAFGVGGILLFLMAVLAWHMNQDEVRVHWAALNGPLSSSSVRPASTPNVSMARDDQNGTATFGSSRKLLNNEWMK